MKSKASFFNLAIFTKNIKRFWPLWSMYLALLMLTMAFSITINISPLRPDYSELIDNSIFSTLQISAGVLPFLFAIAAAIAVYSYLYSSRNSAMMFSLPVKRKALFVTSYISGLSFTIIPAVLTALAMLIIELFRGYTGGVLTILKWLLIAMSSGFFFFSIASLCAVVTGSALVLPLIYGILNLGVPFIEYLMRIMSSHVIYGLTDYISVRFGALSPIYYIIENISNMYAVPQAPGGAINFHGFVYFAVIAAVGIALFFFAMWLFGKRRAEAAGDTIAFKTFGTVFKYLFSLGCALAIGALLYFSFFSYNTFRGNELVITLCMLIGALIGYFGVSMLLSKALRVFNRKNIRGACIVCIGIIFAMLLIVLDVFGFEAYIPESSKITAAYVNNEYRGSTLEIEPSKLATLHHAILDSKDFNQGFVRRYDYSQTENYVSADLTYVLSNGRNVRRSYQIPITQELLADSASPAAQYKAMLDTPDAMRQRLHLDDGTLSYFSVSTPEGESQGFGAPYAQLLQSALEEDCANARASSANLFSSSQKPFVTIWLEYAASGGNQKPNAASTYADITADSTSTWAMLKKLGIALPNYN